MSIAIVLIAICYYILIIVFITAIDTLPDFKWSNKRAKHSFSIIIPFRNEAKHLPSLLSTIAVLQYPKNQFEVLLIDDESEDNSRALIEDFISKHNDLDIQILDNQRHSNSPKKDAITLASKHTKYDWIVTTDADCFLPELWLKAYDNFIVTHDVQMIVAPVTYIANGSLFQQFQLVDFMSLQSATMAGFGLQKPFLCNGANLCYKTSLFENISGFDGNDQIASGDDIFLMEKVLKHHPKQLQYLKSHEATVYTQVQPSLQQLIQQRVRWAAKSSHYNNGFAKGVGLLVFFMNASLLVSFCLALVELISWNYVILPLIFKATIDYIFIRKSVKFFNQPICLRYYFISSLLYPLFSVYVVFHSLLFNYKWKGRSYKK